MADARSIILHHYDVSPFSEKIRLALRLKNLAWASVEIPIIMPKPDLIPLTGGYRRTPVMQIGADVYCDTAVILRELERRYQVPALDLPGHEGLASMVAAWTDGKWFMNSVGVIFGELGEDGAPPGFAEDREKLMGRPFNMEEMAAAAPMLRDQWRAQMMWIEERLQGGRGAGAGNYLVSTKPGMVDVHAHMNVWFVANSAPGFAAECFAQAPRTKAWYDRLNDATGPAPEKLSSKDALAIALKAGPRLVAAVAGGAEPQGLEPGEKVAVAPDDYGKDWVEGTLVHADHQRIIIARTAEEVETINVHFPRAGYMVRRL
ncbi:MAG: glutathione S-transferase [Pseudomonadota bacterium]